MKDRVVDLILIRAIEDLEAYAETLRVVDERKRQIVYSISNEIIRTKEKEREVERDHSVTPKQAQDGKLKEIR